MSDRRLWTPQEDIIIMNLINQYGSSNWTTIASQMRILISNPRSSKQIRQRWNNQLAPSIAKDTWSKEQQDILFSLHSSMGNKWKQIAKELTGRTDNSIKNHFYSTVRRSLRRLDKFFGFKDSTKKMRNLKPAALTYLLQQSRNQPYYSQLMELIIDFSRWKPSKMSVNNTKSNQGRILYEKIINLISNFNETYARKSKKNDLKIKKMAQFLQKQQAFNQMNTNNTINHGFQQNNSTISNLNEEQQSNYFGSCEQNQSNKNWFTVEERNFGLVQLKVAEEGLQIIGLEDNEQQ